MSSPSSESTMDESPAVSTSPAISDGGAATSDLLINLDLLGCDLFCALVHSFVQGIQISARSIFLTGTVPKDREIH
jgi:hypothetical protein